LKILLSMYALARNMANTAIYFSVACLTCTAAVVALPVSTNATMADTSLAVETKSAIGVTASLAAVRNAVPSTGVNGVPNCCNAFGNQPSIGWDVALRYAVPLSSARILVSAGVSQVGVTSEVTQNVGNVLVNGMVVPATVANQLTLSNTFATVGLGIEFPLVSKLQAWAAVTAGIPLRQVFSQKEVLQTPSAQFENGGTERNVISDVDVGDNAVMIMPTVGLRYSIDVAEGWVVGPHLGIQWSPVSSSKRLDSWTWLSGIFGVLIERSL